MARPSASVIVPFLGSPFELRALLARLRGLRLAEGDEVLVADNRPRPSGPATERHEEARVAIVPAPGRRSAPHARNAAAARARGEWLVFLDADTAPAPDLLDAYLDPPPAEDVAVLVGAVEDRAERDTLCARYITARRKLDQANTLAHPYRPYGQTANCAVRRAAFEAVGGFADEIRLGDDADLCWRLQDADWRLESRPAARVAHRNREHVRDLLGQMSRHGMGLAWLELRHPGSAPRPRARDLVGRAPHYLGAARRARDREERLYALLDLASLYARDLGRLRSNRA